MSQYSSPNIVLLNSCVNSLWHIITSSRVNGGSGHFIWSRKERVHICTLCDNCDNLTTGGFGAVTGDLIFVARSICPYLKRHIFLHLLLMLSLLFGFIQFWVLIFFDLFNFWQQPLSYALQAPQDHRRARWPGWLLSAEKQEEKFGRSPRPEGAKVCGWDNQQKRAEREEKGSRVKAQPESKLCSALW